MIVKRTPEDLFVLPSSSANNASQSSLTEMCKNLVASLIRYQKESCTHLSNKSGILKKEYMHISCSFTYSPHNPLRIQQ